MRFWADCICRCASASASRVFWILCSAAASSCVFAAALSVSLVSSCRELLGLLLSSAHEPVPNLGELAGPCRDVLLVRVDLDGKRLLPLLGVTQLLLQRGKLLPPALGLGLNLFELLPRGLDLLLDSGELPARFVTVLLNALKLGLRYRDAARQVRGRARARLKLANFWSAVARSLSTASILAV